MLSINECKKYLKNLDLTDAQVERIRDSLDQLVNNLFDDYLKNNE